MKTAFVYINAPPLYGNVVIEGAADSNALEAVEIGPPVVIIGCGGGGVGTDGDAGGGGSEGVGFGAFPTLPLGRTTNAAVGQALAVGTLE